MAATPSPPPSGCWGSVARKYAHKIPFIVKINHNELLTYPNQFDQVLFGIGRQAFEMGAAAVGATIYFGSDRRHPPDPWRSREAFEQAHELGMATVLWCYLRNSAFKTRTATTTTLAADLTGQANHLGVTIQADIIKQKLPEQQRRLPGAQGLRQDSTSWSTTSWSTDHPIDLCRWQVANCYMGRVGLINSGGESKGRTTWRGGAHGRDQQAGRRRGPDLRPQGLPAAACRRAWRS